MILLQILDEGSITDSQGRKVDFKVILLSSFFTLLLILLRCRIPSFASQVTSVRLLSLEITPIFIEAIR